LTLLQKYTQGFIGFDHLVKESNFEGVKNLLVIVLLICWAKYVTVWYPINKVLELDLGFGTQKDITFLGTDQNDHFAVDLLKIFIGVDMLSGLAEKEPVEEVCR
jgi:hypothetical protein